MSAQILHEGFEDVAVGPVSDPGLVAGWNISTRSGVTANFSIIEDQVHQGTQALEVEVGTISGTDPGDIFVSSREYPLSVPADSLIEISFYAKASKNGLQLKLDVVQEGARGNKVSSLITLSTEYKRYYFDYYSFAEQDIGVVFNFAYRKYDVYHLDDIQIKVKKMPPEADLDSVYKKSDIVFTVTQSADVYRQFNADMISWGWLPTPLSESKISSWKNTVKLVQSNGLRYQGRTEVDAGWKNMIAYDPDGFEDDIVTTLDGKKVVSPWFEGRYYLGHPAYWFCTNSAGFQDFLRHQVSMLVSGGVNSILFDAQVGTPLPVKQAGGCFCHHCVAGFRSYMQEKFSIQDLKDKGIEDAANFNYGDYLRNLGWNETSYKQQSRSDYPSIPLFGDFQEYQYRRLNDLSSELSRLADQLAGKPLVFSSSSNPGQHFRSVFVPEIDYYTQELHLYASRLRVPTEPILNYAMADALKKGMDLTGIPQWDWNVIYAKDRPALVRSWIAQAYAYGARFIVPIWNWAGGTDFYYGDPKEYEFIYDFIHTNSTLFDGYELSAQVGLLMPYEGTRYGTENVDQAIKNLIVENIPFNLVISGGKWWNKKLEEWDLKRFDLLALSPDMQYLNITEKALADRYKTKSSGSADTTSMFAILPRQIDVSAGNEKVNVVPRVNHDSPEVPYVVHLVNMQYNEAEIAMDTVKDFTISFKHSLFNRDIIEATLLRPGEPSLDLEMDSIKNGFSVSIPELAQWGLIRMKSDPASEVKYQIYGRNEDGEVWLLPEAEIKTGRNYIKTNSEGETSIWQVPGAISYEVKRKGYASSAGDFYFTGDTIIQDTLDYETYKLTVHVSDGLTEEAIQDAIVSFGDFHGLSDASGIFEVSDQRYGIYSLEISRDQYNTIRREVELYSDSLFEVTLPRNIYSVTFHMVDSVLGSDLQGVEILLNGKRRISGSDGLLAVTSPFGDWDYSISKENYDSNRGTLSLYSDTLIMRKMKRIHSSVVFRISSNGSGVYKALVNLNGISGESNSVGMLGFTQVPVYENLEYKVNKEGFQPVEGELWLTGDTTIQVDLGITGMESSARQRITVYPNPVNNELTVSGLQGENFIQLLDLTGRILISDRYHTDQVKLQLDDLTSGTYILKVRPEEAESTIIMIAKE